MEFHTFAFALLYLVILGNAQNRVKLSTQLNRVTGFPAFDWNFPFKVFQYLPNPAYHGFEKKNRADENFHPQPACSDAHTNLSVGSSGVITSPNYPKNYPIGLRCQWTLESEPGTVIRVTFFDIVTQPWFLFFYDYLAVSLNGDWDQFYRLTGDMNKLAPISLESEDNKLGLRFASGFDLFNYRGFKMAYVVTRRPVADEGTPGHNSTAPTLDYGNGTSVSAICDYVPITLPPDSIGETPEKKVIGGPDVSPHEFPFAVVMIMDNVKFCSGSLIDESHVLTAAHCLPEGTEKIELYFGVHDMRQDEEETRQYQVINAVKSVVRHPDYDPMTSANDIAIIRLNRNVKMTAFVQPVYLPSAYSMANSFRGWKLITMGWGNTNNETSGEDEQGQINPILKKATMPVLPNEDCREAYRTLITGNILCTDGSSGESPCHGDSGAPLVAKFSRSQNMAEEVPAVVNDDNQANQCYFTKSHRNRANQEKLGPDGSRSSDWFVQLGVLSFGSQTCGSKKPVAFTRVTAYLDFISDAVSRKSI